VLFICDNVVPHERHFADVSLTKFAFHFADYFIVQSRSVESNLHEFAPNARYAFVPHPIYNVFGDALPKEEARRRLGLVDERTVLFFGYVRRYKGLHLLLEAMPQILRHMPVRLLIVGEFYDDEEAYKKEIQKLGLADHVTVNSQYIPNDEVALYFSACDAVVLPYISATQSGIVQIAYHFDKPVIATNVGGLAEVVIDNETGLIVAPLDPAKLSESIVRFYKEEKESTFVKNVKREKTKYSWDRMVEAIEGLTKAGT
jgi:glycosyltransferase involved in cell wall biosynthesis